MSIKNVWKHDNEEYKADAIKILKKYFPVGTEIAMDLTHVSDSGMMKVIKVYGYNRENRKIVNVSEMVARVTERKFDDKRRGVVVTGGNIDARGEVALHLGKLLHTGTRSKKLKHRDPSYSLSYDAV